MISRLRQATRGTAFTYIVRLEQLDLGDKEFEALANAVSSSLQQVDNLSKLCIGAFSASIILLIAVLSQIIGKPGVTDVMAQIGNDIAVLFVTLNLGFLSSVLLFFVIEIQLESVAFIKAAKIVNDPIIYTREVGSLRRLQYWFRVIVFLLSVFAVISVISYIRIAAGIIKFLT